MKRWIKTHICYKNYRFYTSTHRVSGIEHPVLVRSDIVSYLNQMDREDLHKIKAFPVTLVDGEHGGLEVEVPNNIFETV